MGMDKRGPALLPWRELMGLGLGLLRIRPKDFWAMTPRELTAALSALEAGVGDGAGAMDSVTLARLMGKFPDRHPDDETTKDGNTGEHEDGGRS